MTDAVPPNMDTPPSNGGPVPYIPQTQPNPAAQSGRFDPRRIVQPGGMTRQDAGMAQVPAPYPAHPGWAGEPAGTVKKPSFLSRLISKPDAPVAATSSGPIKPFIAGFLFGVSLVLIVGRGWNTPEPEGPAWTLPTTSEPEFVLPEPSETAENEW